MKTNVHLTPRSSLDMKEKNKSLVKFTSHSSKNIKNLRKKLLYVSLYPVIILALSAGVFLSSLHDNGTKAASTLTPTPTQPAGFFYDTDPPVSWARPGALVICGRNNCGNQAFKNVSAAGGTVLVYLDTIVNVSAGKYHSLYMNQYYPNASDPNKITCGGAVGLWPGGGRFNSWGYVNDVRVGSTAQSKLSCVLEKIVADNPHIGGFFADDLGSANGNTQAGLPSEEYYQAAVGLSKTFRSVADKHGLMFIPNGSWEGGRNAGYPTRNVSGNALADGSCVEHHSASELSFWTNYLRNGQWANQSAVTHGTPFHIIITNPGNDFNAYKNANFNGFIANQSDYAGAGTPWGLFHVTGLPTKVAGSVTPTPAPSPTPTPIPAPTPTPTPSGQTPYGGSAKAIPGKIEAEDYDNGGQDVSYHDSDTGNNGGQYRTTDVDIENSQEGGYSIGWGAPGEWLEYTANSQAGNYTVDLRLASAVTGSKITLKYDGTTLKTVDIPNTGGWYTWKTVSIPNISIPAGSNKILRLEISGNAVNINNATFIKQVSNLPVPPVTTTPTPTPTNNPHVPEVIVTRPAEPAPLIVVPGSGSSALVPIPKDVIKNSDGQLTANFNGDGLNDLAFDLDGDGNIDPSTEIVVNGASEPDLTDKSADPTYASLDLNLSGSIEPEKNDSGSITINAGPFKDISIPKPVAYTFLTAQAFALSGLAGYLAITKLAFFATLRGKIGL